MVEDDGKPKDESVPQGKETTDNPKEDKKPAENTEGVNALDRAETANKEKARLIEEDKKLMDRKEKLHAAQMVGGHTVAGQEVVKPKELSDEEYADKFMKGEADPLTDDGISID